METKEFGVRLRQLREQASLSQSELANKVGVNFTYLSKIESGVKPPPSEKLILRLAEVLNADKDELLTLAGKIPADIAEILRSQETLQSLRSGRAQKKSGAADKKEGFNIRLRQLREQAGLSQRELADKVGVSFTYLSKIENGVTPPPSQKVILRLAEVLDANRDELMTLAGKIPADIAQMLKKRETLQFLRSGRTQKKVRAANKKEVISIMKNLLNYKRLSRVAIPITLVIAIAASLWFAAPSPVRALNVQITNPPRGVLGETYSFEVEVIIEDGELLPIQSIDLYLRDLPARSLRATWANLPLADGDTRNYSGTFGTVGVTARAINWGVGFGYGYAAWQGYGYSFFPPPTGYGYGYGYGGYGVGAASIRYIVTWTPPPDPAWAGNYIVEASISANGRTFTQESSAFTLTVTAVTLQSIAVTPATAPVAAGRTLPFTAIGTYSDNSTANITGIVNWTSSDTSIASIQTIGQAYPGLATGLQSRAAPVTITATSGSVNGTASLTVTPAVLDSITVTPVDPIIVHAGTQQFRAVATYTDGSVTDITTTATWASSNNSTATINSAGLATSVAAGSTNITASVGTVTSLPVTLRVTTAQLQSIAVSPDLAPASVAAGLTKQFKATGTYTDNATATITNFVTWRSSDNTVARVSAAGLATSYVQGAANIIATSGNISGSTTLTVNPAVLESIAVTPVDPTITFVSRAAPTLQFTATGINTNGSTVILTGTNWTSSAQGVATIGLNTGLATTVDPGATSRTTTITATWGQISGSTTLTVLPDTVAPVVTLTSPSEGHIISSTNLPVNGKVDDVNATTSVIVNGGTPTILAVNPVSGVFTQLVTLNVGSNTVLVRAVDGSGNTGVSGTRTVVVDPLKPTITITSPAEGALTRNPSLTVTGTVSVNVTSPTLTLNGVSQPITVAVNGSFTVPVTLTGTENIIVVNAYATGQPIAPAYLGTSGVRTVILDTTSPIVTINSPVSGSVVSTAGREVSGTVDDPGVNTANLTLNGGVPQAIPVVSGSFSHNVFLAARTNTITVVATDNVGNTSSATSVTVIFDNTKPGVTIITPTNNLLTNITGQTVSGNVSDPSITWAYLYLNGVSENISVAPNGSFSKVKTLTAGVNTIEVTARDNAVPPNIGTSGNVTVVVDTTAPALTIGLSDPTDSIIITVSSNETLVRLPAVSVGSVNITMTQVGIGQWTGVFEPIPAGSYTVTATGVDTAGNPTTVTAGFTKRIVTIPANTTQQVRTSNTRAAITTNTTVTNEPVSLTSTSRSPSGNVRAPAEAQREAGLFSEIVASSQVLNNLRWIDIEIDYNPDDIRARGIVESSLRLYLWNVTTGQWEPVPDSSANVTGNYISGRVTHLSKYGAFGTARVPVPPPLAPGRPPAVVPVPAPVVVAPGVVDVSKVVTTEGKFTQAVSVKSDDDKGEVAIPKDTIGKTKEGEPISRISATTVAVPPAPPADARAISLTYELGPSGATFAPAITITFTYDPTKIPVGVSEKDLVIARWDENAGKWVDLKDITVDTVANTASAPVARFSMYAVMARLPVVPPVVEVPPVVAPAVFSVSNLTVQPAEVQPKEAVSISVLVANTGGTEGSYTVVLKINGVKEAEKNVTIAAGASQTVTFSVTREETGSYSVVVDNLSASFTVVAPPAVAPPEEVVPEVPPAPIAGWVWLIVGLAAVLVIGVIIWIIRRRTA